MRASRKKMTLWSVAGFIVVLAVLAAIYAATFILTSFIYEKTGLHPSPVLAQVITSLLGLVFVFLIAGGSGYLFRGRQMAGQMRIFQPILNALERIAQGDFSIRIEDTFGRHEGNLFGELVNSVNNMAQELNEMEKMRQEFISNVSHEIQSPLTSIRGFAEALKSETLSPEERQHYLSVIENESRRLSRITENLLRLAALEADHVKFAPQAYRLDKQIRSLILACEPQWMEKGLDLDASLAEVTITADEDLLSQVWINLIHNGIKFTPPGGKLCVALHPQGEAVEFTIADTGIGISPEDLEHIFERFYKADRSRTRSQEGSGLGLSIAKKIVDLHSGTIRAESQAGVGTTFIVRLPG
jgi:two-component system, OmpR family, phosphate regulon sensor histidine kinase PhoR